MSARQDTEIVLARHGRTAANFRAIYSGRSHDPLDETGRKQARLLAERLTGDPPENILCSPVLRARMTAEAVAGKTGLTLTIADFLSEIDFGEWSGLTGEKIAEVDPKQWEIWRDAPHLARVPGGETLDEVRARMDSGLAGVRETCGGKRVLLVTHDVNIRLAVLITLGLLNSSYRSLKIDNASLTSLSFSGGAAQVNYCNDTGHLAG